MSGRDTGDPWGSAYYEVAALARKRALVERVAAVLLAEEEGR